MRPIATEYTKYGYNNRQVSREGDVAVYEQSLPETGRVIGYEVFLIQKNQATVLPNGRTVEAAELPPSSANWGRLGFTVHTLEEAAKKIKRLHEGVDRRAGNAS